MKPSIDRLADKQFGRPSGSLPSNTQPNPKGHNSKAYQTPQSRNEHMNDVFTRSVIRVKQKQLNLGVGTERMIFNIDSAMKHSYSNDDTCFSIDVIDEILEEDFDALLDEGSKILHSIEGTLLEEEIFVEFDEFMAMTADENSDSESDTEDPPFEKITINTDYKIKTSLEEPPTDLKLKPLPDNLEYVFLEEPSFLPIIISYQLSKEKKKKLISVLKKHKQAFAWKTIYSWFIAVVCALFRVTDVLRIGLLSPFLEHWYWLKIIFERAGIGQKIRYDLCGFKDLSMVFNVYAEKSNFVN
ncbi:hypothetical protein Tco_0781988 [Tanacetum coccineum]